METLLYLLVIVFLTIDNVLSLNNGLARTPPLGWRSWNCYWFDIDQTLIQNVMTALLDKSRSVNGIATSLAEIGYNNAGIDDGWQHCNAYEKLFHNNSAPNGWPVLNKTLFPDLPGLIKYAHDNKLGVNWYFNNCKCSEHEPYPANEANDVEWMRLMDFDGVKLDGCGSSMNTSNWNRLINETSNKPILTEDGGNAAPPSNTNEDQCPMNMYNFAEGNGYLRSNYVPNPNYPMLIDVLQGIIPFVNPYPSGYLSRPGCWAFPGDLQTGNFAPQYGINDVSIMDQTIFSSWAIASSPLVLGFDLMNETTLDRVWPIITNNETIAVSQNWAGHPGRQISYANYTVSYDISETDDALLGQGVSAKLWGYEIWAKPQPQNTWAVLIMNNDDMNARGTHDINVQFEDIPWKGPAHIRDIVNHKDLGEFSGSYTAKNVPQFGSLFLLFS
eukprot:211808_1